MGRRQLPPEQKAAHGTVRTRKSKASKRADELQAAAAAIAAMPIGTKVEPPPILRGPKFERALAVWNDLGPELERTNRLQPLHRRAFGMFCIYLAEWELACEDLAQRGRSQSVPTVSGGVMERDRPAVRWRAEAFAAAQDAAQQFGLTPREEYALFKDQSMVARDNPGLFGRAQAEPAADEPGSGGSTIGGMARAKSAGPPARPH